MLYAGNTNAGQYISLQQNTGTKSVHGSEFENFTDCYQIDIDIKEEKNVRIDYFVDLGPNDDIGICEVDQNGGWNEIFYTCGPLYQSGTVISSNNTGKIVFLINRWSANNGTGTGFDIKYGPDNSLVSNTGLYVGGDTYFSNGCRVSGNLFSYNNTYTYGHNICFANTGLGTSSPATRLHVIANSALGNSAGNTATITRLQGSANTNYIYVNDYLLRETAGEDWTTASYIRGIGVDYSFLTPTTLRSWIKQNPHAEKIDFGSSGATFMSVGSTVQIGSTNTAGNLIVNGKITATEVNVKSDVWADYVFDKNYKLRDLKEVDQYIQDNGHLPEIPSTAEVKEKGVNLVEVQTKLLQKVEEMTLYILAQEKKISQLEEKVQQLSGK